MMALSLASLVVTIAVGVAAIWITLRLSREAEDSLHKSTKVAALATGQVLRSIHHSQRPNVDRIIDAGAPYWNMTQTMYVIEPGGTIELDVHQSATESNPLYQREDTIVNPHCVVLTPSGRNFKTTPKRQHLDDFNCSWRAKYPTDFPDADSKEEGLYTVECSVPDENYDRIFGSFFVLA